MLAERVVCVRARQLRDHGGARLAARGAEPERRVAAQPLRIRRLDELPERGVRRGVAMQRDGRDAALRRVAMAIAVIAIAAVRARPVRDDAGDQPDALGRDDRVEPVDRAAARVHGAAGIRERQAIDRAPGSRARGRPDLRGCRESRGRRGNRRRRRARSGLRRRSSCCDRRDETRRARATPPTPGPDRARSDRVDGRPAGRARRRGARGVRCGRARRRRASPTAPARSRTAPPTSLRSTCRSRRPAARAWRRRRP